MSDPICLSGPSGNPPVRLRDTAMALLTWLAADTIASVAILASAVVILRKRGHLTPHQMAEILPGDFTFLVTAMTVSAVVALSILWRYSKRTDPKSFGIFFPAVPGRVIAWAAASAMAVIVIELGLENTLHALGIALPVSKPEAAIHPTSWTQLATVTICLAGIVPFFEEVLFRGYIFGWLKRVLPLWPAIVVSAAVFAAVHGLYVSRGGFSGWFGTAEIFAIGVVLAWWAARTGSLRTSYAVHATINAASFAIGFLLPGL